jgi:hypothetical protein
MIIVRIIILFSLLIIGGCYAAFLITKDRRYLRFMGQLLRFGLYFLAAAGVFYILERLILI